MSFAQDNGYTPVDFATLMDFVRQGINDQFSTSYTVDTFVGTNWYKYFYTLIQKIQENETKTGEIFHKLQQYITLTNERIQRPSVSAPGLLDAFEAEGYEISVRAPADGDPGKTAICVNTDNGDPGYPATKIAICTLIKTFIAAGILTEGTETESIVLSNGQAFDFSFNLPNAIPVLLKLTCVESENNLLSIPADDVLRQTVFDQVNARYHLGLNFEPQRYFSLADALWAGQVTLEWSDDAGGSWHSTIFDADFDDLYTFDLEDITVVVS